MKNHKTTIATALTGLALGQLCLATPSHAWQDKPVPDEPIEIRLGCDPDRQPAAEKDVPSQPMQVPQYDFFPLPDSSDTYWWMFKICQDGGVVKAAGSSSVCGTSPYKLVGIAAEHTTDGAFDGESLITLEFFKEDPATYWGANREQILRWYSRGFTWVSTGVKDSDEWWITANQFLSFRGHSVWCADDGGSTNFWVNGANLYSLPQQYSSSSCQPGMPSEFMGATRYQRNDSPQVPMYAVVPDEPLDADVLFTAEACSAETFCDFEPVNGFSRLQGCDSGALPGGGCCCGNYQHDLNWFVSWREIPTWAFNYKNKRVQYAGFSETSSDPNNQIGACEEWWFAEDVGPIYIVSHAGKTHAQCLELLNGTTSESFEYDPEDHIARRPSAADVLRLQTVCRNSTCAVTP